MRENVPFLGLRGIILAVEKAITNSPLLTVLGVPVRAIPCAALCEGEFGIDGYFIGVPTVIGCNGIEKILEFKLMEEESNQLNNTLEAVKKTVKETKL